MQNDCIFRLILHGEAIKTATFQKQISTQKRMQKCEKRVKAIPMLYALTLFLALIQNGHL